MNLTSPSSSAFAAKPSLAEWLVDFCRSAEYAELVRQIEATKETFTNSDEVAVLYGLIKEIRPALSLEVGTFFAHSTYYMAEAVVDAGIDGKVVTIDPFGGHRVPEIIERWPSPLRAVTEFKPYNSMQYFLELETTHCPKGADSPLGVVFVDGHHNFEYALYDIIRSADHLRPGGAIVIDNMEQEGPRSAAFQFLQWNPAWKMFYDGRILSAEQAHEATGNDSWSVLVAPSGIQVGRSGVKIHKVGEASGAPICGIALRTEHVSDGGTLHANMSYYSVPYDFHLTGEGISHTRSKATATITDEQSSVVLQFEQPMRIDAIRSDINIWYELELNYIGKNSRDHLLLNAGQPLSIIYAAGV